MFERLRNINLKTVSLLLFLFGIFLISVPFMFTLPTWLGIDFSTTGQIGDTIGGTTAPFIGFGGIILTFAAFWVQYRANINQREDIKFERFENKFYEMVRLHRENVAEISIKRKTTVKARRAFISMFREFTFCYHALKLIYGSQKELKTIQAELNERDFINISYITFFMGVGDESDKLTDHLLVNYEKPLIVNYTEILIKYQQSFRKNEKVAVDVQRPDGTKTVFKLEIGYTPFDGHMSRLSHYYRHLFQAVKYVDAQPDRLVPNKYDYTNTIRAQLSSHEQLLLYYNALSRLGRPWIDEGYMQNYCMVKNMPFPLADIGPDPVETLGETNEQGREMFEWKEVVP